MLITNTVKVEVEIQTLKELRQTRGWSQEDAATACGMSQAYWAELEDGKRYGMPKKIKQIADAFGLHYYDVVAIILRTDELANAEAAVTTE
jgi:transcriptional regulator with XRE-family HTH domain